MKFLALIKTFAVLLSLSKNDSLYFLVNSIILSGPGGHQGGEIMSNSPHGKALLNIASRIDSESNISRHMEDNKEEDNYYWLSKYALKFQGCHNVKQWNENVDNKDDVRIQTYRLVRFRLCPVESCSSRSSRGCHKGYGEYIVDINTYVTAYVQTMRDMKDYECQLYKYNHCDCEESDDKRDDFNRDICDYQCFMRGRKNSCIDRNPYENDENDERDIDMYFEGGCHEFEIPYYSNENAYSIDNYGNRILEDEEEKNETYYIGAYCGDQGGKIYLGMFTDDTCTNFADENSGQTTYKALTRGEELPYSTQTLVGMDCISCLEHENPGKEQNDSWGARTTPTNECVKTYKVAGKCETHLNINKYDGPSFLNNASCYFLEGIKIIRRDGILDTSVTRTNAFVSFFIFVFAVSFILLGAYIYYLRMKLGMKILLN